MNLPAIAVFALFILAAARLWAGGIADEPPPTDDERREWFG